MIQHAQPFVTFQAIAPEDGVDLPLWGLQKLATAAVYVGTGGDVVAVSPSNVPTTFANVPSGTTLTIAVRRINATNTSASNLVALYTN